MSTESSKLRLGHVSYINALPIYGALIRREIQPSALLVSGYPSQLNSQLLAKELDVSLISSIEYLRNRDRLVLLPTLCLAATEKVQSTLLYVREEIHSLDSQRIAVSVQSASVAQLLKVLCTHFWNVRPEYVALDSLKDYAQFAAFVLIGDEALMHQELLGYKTIDLATAWHVRTLLPFTFAVFAARKEVMEERADEVFALMNQLEYSLCWAEDHREAICQMAVTQSSLSRQLILNYYSLLHYRMNQSIFDSLRLFASLSQLSPLLKEEVYCPSQELIK